MILPVDTPPIIPPKQNIETLIEKSIVTVVLSAGSFVLCFNTDPIHSSIT